MLVCSGIWLLPCVPWLRSAGWCFLAEGRAALASLSTFIHWCQRGCSSLPRLRFPLNRDTGCDAFLPSVRKHAVLQSLSHCGSCLGLGTHSHSCEAGWFPAEFLCNLHSAGSKTSLVRVHVVVARCGAGKPVEWGGRGRIPKCVCTVYATVKATVKATAISGVKFISLRWGRGGKRRGGSVGAICCAVENVTTKRKHSLRSLLNLHCFGFHMWLQIRYHVINGDLFIREQLPSYAILILINKSRENKSSYIQCSLGAQVIEHNTSFTLQEVFYCTCNSQILLFLADCVITLPVSSVCTNSA